MEKAAGIAALALGIVYLWMARSIPARVFYDPIGPRIFPTIVALGILTCGTVMLWQAIRATPKAPASGGAQPTKHSASRRYAVIAALSGLILAYALLIETVGYMLVTAVLLLIVSTYLNRGRHLQNVLVSVFLTAGVYLGFTRFLRVRLPDGWLDLPF